MAAAAEGGGGRVEAAAVGPGLRLQRGRRRAEAEVTKAAAAAAVFLTVAETKAAAADGSGPAPAPCSLARQVAGPGPAAPPRLPLQLLLQGDAGDLARPVLRALLQPPPGSRRRWRRHGRPGFGGDVEPGLPVEVRGSNGAFYKVRRAPARDAVFSPSLQPERGRVGVDR